MIHFIAITAFVAVIAVAAFAIGKLGYAVGYGATIAGIEAEFKAVEATASADVKALIASIRAKF